MKTLPNPQPSPTWGTTTKLVIGLTVMAVLGALLIAFRSIIGPLLLTFVLTYLLYPLAVGVRRMTRLPWKVSANLVFFTVLLVIIGLAGWLGVAIVQQLQSLITVISDFINKDLALLLEDLSVQVYQIGPFILDLSQLNLEALGQQILSNVQSLVGQTGTLLTTVASGAVGGVGWVLFILLIAYFVLIDIRRLPGISQYISAPGYEYDMGRLQRELGRIWNAYLRGQLIVIILVVITSFIFLSILQVRYNLGIALLTGIARLVPYLGSLTTNTVTFLVVFFQRPNAYGIDPLIFALIVVGLGILMDSLYDNVISPRMLGQALGVHPAAVLVVAIIATNLIGIVGLVLAAPVLATVQLVARYVLRKLFDQDPWPEPEHENIPLEWPGRQVVERAWQALQARFTAWRQSLTRPQDHKKP